MLLNSHYGMQAVYARQHVSLITSNEPPCSTKYGEFSDQLDDFQLLKKDATPWDRRPVMLETNVEYTFTKTKIRLCGRYVSQFNRRTILFQDLISYFVTSVTNAN